MPSREFRFISNEPGISRHHTNYTLPVQTQEQDLDPVPTTNRDWELLDHGNPPLVHSKTSEGAADAAVQLSWKVHSFAQ